MKSDVLGAVCTCALTLSAAMPGHASFVLSGGAIQNLPVTGNEFNAELTAPNLDQMTSGAQLRVSRDGFVDFAYIGAESAFTNTFTSGSYWATEQNEGFDFSGYSGFSIAVSAGDIVNFAFTSDDLDALSPVDNFGGTNLQGLGIYFDSSQSGSLLQVVLGYDDQIFNDDNDFEDMLVRADFRPVPAAAIAPLTSAALIGAVPVPPAVYLFGSSLLGLIGVARRNAT